MLLWPTLWSYYWCKGYVDWMTSPWGQEAASEAGKPDRIGWEAQGVLWGGKVFHSNCIAGSLHQVAVLSEGLQSDLFADT